jgi:CrcB protein
MSLAGRGRRVRRDSNPVASEFDQVIDPDVDLHDPRQRRETSPRQWDLVLATSLGGVVGALGRYGVDLAVPHRTVAFPWSTVLINATGSLLIGALMVVLLELTSPHRLARPFLGVGILGGYTTYSTFAVDVQRLVVEHRAGIAFLYVVVTVGTCAAAVMASTLGTLALGRNVAARRRERRPQP